MVRLSSFLSAAVVVTVLFSCVESNLPQGLYDYQALRLLAADSSKLWLVQEGISRSDCEKLSYYLLTNLEDSIALSSVAYNCDTGGFSDTSAIGFGTPSALGLVFTDTIYWSTGDYWIVHELSSQYVEYTGNLDSNRSTLVSD